MCSSPGVRDLTAGVGAVPIQTLKTRERATGLLSRLGLGDRLRFRPDQLSGDEKQRVAIARALANDPQVILADEPTANLDSGHGRDIARLLRQLAVDEGRSVLIVSHDDRLKQIADRVLWLEDGRFRELAGMATDPVCGMAVESGPAPTSNTTAAPRGSAPLTAATSSPPYPTSSFATPPRRPP